MARDEDGETVACGDSGQSQEVVNIGGMEEHVKSLPNVLLYVFVSVCPSGR